MKKNEINFNHAADTLDAALGLNKEQAANVQDRVKNICGRKASHSEAAAEIISEYEEDPAKQAYGLLILESTEEGLVMGAFLSRLQGEPEVVGEKTEA